jgi:hypothetical protein
LIRKFFSAIRNALAKAVTAVWKTVDLRDCFVFGGLGILFYGLYLFRPWVAFTVCGTILLSIGVFIDRLSPRAR